MNWRSLFPFLSKEKKLLKNDFHPLQVDAHSHLIPGIDDGVQSVEEAVEVIRELYHLGFRKLTTTPHVMQEGFPNTPETILGGLPAVQQALREQQIPVQLDAAAEYFLDEHFEKKITGGAQLLTIGDNYLFFELPFLNKPPNFKEVIFELQSAGYKLILAHPERYAYFHDRQMRAYRQMREDMGIMLQLNLLSLVGAYSPVVKKVAQDMVNNKLIDITGTDVHGMKHIAPLRECLKDRFIVDFIENYPLKNNQLY